jgi:hypothetical protein
VRSDVCAEEKKKQKRNVLSANVEVARCAVMGRP